MQINMATKQAGLMINPAFFNGMTGWRVTSGAQLMDLPASPTGSGKAIALHTGGSASARLYAVDNNLTSFKVPFQLHIILYIENKSTGQVSLHSKNVDGGVTTHTHFGGLVDGVNEFVYEVANNVDIEFLFLNQSNAGGKVYVCYVDTVEFQPPVIKKKYRYRLLVNGEAENQTLSEAKTVTIPKPKPPEPTAKYTMIIGSAGGALGYTMPSFSPMGSIEPNVWADTNKKFGAVASLNVGQVFQLACDDYWSGGNSDWKGYSKVALKAAGGILPDLILDRSNDYGYCSFSNKNPIVMEWQNHFAANVGNKFMFDIENVPGVVAFVSWSKGKEWGYSQAIPGSSVTPNNWGNSSAIIQEFFFNNYEDRLRFKSSDGSKYNGSDTVDVTFENISKTVTIHWDAAYGGYNTRIDDNAVYQYFVGALGDIRTVIFKE